MRIFFYGSFRRDAAKPTWRVTSAWLWLVLACAGLASATTQSEGVKARAGAAQRLVMISITPSNPSVAAGLSIQFRATGLYKDGSQQDLTTQVNWRSSTGAATVSNTPGSQGLTTGVTSGSTVISASIVTSSGTVTGSTGLTVRPAIVVSIIVTPSNSSVPAGLTLQYSATGQYSDQTTKDITAGATWASSNSAVASVSNAAGSQGLATGLGTGATTVSATYQSVTGTTGLSVTAPILQSIALTPPNSSLAAGLTMQYTATGRYSDQSTQDLTTSVTWASSASSVATVSNTEGSQGLATGVAIGSSTISASYQSLTGSTGLSVLPPVLQSIAVTPADASLPMGLTLQYTATGTYSDGSTQDLSGAASWSSSDASANIASTPGSAGLATGVAVGSTTISAAYQSITGGTGLTVTAPILQSLSVTPSNASLALGLKLQYFATAQFSDHSTQDVTNSATWSASDVSAATVSNSAGTLGLASSIAPGNTSITATYQSVPGSTGLTVTPPALQSIVVTPSNGTLPPSAILRYSAMGHYTDGTIQDVTNSCTWASSSSTVATISNTSGSDGVASAISNGTTNISATYQAIVGSTNLVVANVSPFTAQLMGMSVNNPNFSPTTVGVTAWPTVPFGAFRLWDNGAAWHQLQPTPSTYTWEPLNGWLTFIRGHGITDIIYTFGSTPQWASSNPTDATCKYGPGTCYPPLDLNADGTGADQYWINFVAALAQQALGRIQYYQLWDTPKDSTHWKGTDAQLVRMSRDAYQTIKSIDPGAQVLSPPSGAYHIAATNTCAIANREKPFFMAGGGPYVDIISFNSYFGSMPEDIVPALQCFQTMLASYQQQGKPWWNSEGSWGTTTDLADPTQQAAFLARSYLVQVSFNVQRYYWYSWNNHTWGTLWDRNTGLHLAGKTYAQMYQWLVGATLVQPCIQDQNGVWSCVIIRPNGYQALALWTAGLPQPYQAPALYMNSRALSGTRTSITPGTTVTVGIQPQLLENQ
jgi:Bacterial Ig-like domain (group 2)